MKKILIVLLTALMIAGCSNKGYSKLTNGDQVLFSTPDKDYTRNDLYKSLKISSQSAVENELIIKIADNQGIDYSSSKDDALELYDTYVNMGQEAYLLYQYGSKDGFIRAYAVSDIMNQYAKEYVENDIEKYTTNDSPFKMQYCFFDNVDAANKLIEDVNNGKTFDTAAIDAGYSNSTQASVYVDSDNLPIELKDYVSSTDKMGISSVITVTSTSMDEDNNPVDSDSYYVVNLISKDYKDFKDDYVALKVANLSAETLKAYIFSKCDIDFFDQDIYEMMINDYEDLK